MKNIFIAVVLFLLFKLVPGKTSSDDFEDPCFFETVLENEKEIYILGSVHSVKIIDCLPLAALEELNPL